MRLSLYSFTKISLTAAESHSSIVNLSFSQSRDAQSFLCCWVIIHPCFLFHSRVLSINFSLHKSSLVFHSSANALSTLFWVAIPAWSVPGIQRVLYPDILFHLTNTSWIDSSRIWPIWRIPVTFGGGITIAKLFLSGLVVALKYHLSSQIFHHLGSISLGLYLSNILIWIKWIKKNLRIIINYQRTE